MAHAVDLLVDRGFLLDVGVGARNVGLGLVVVVVADEILDRVVRKERPELAVELGRQRLVGRQHQRRALGVLDHLRHREGLARSGHAEQDLGAVLALDALDDVADRLRLVALGLEVRFDHQALAAFGLLRPRRPVRRPRPLAEFGPALAQQRLQRLHRGGRAGDAAEGRQARILRRGLGLLRRAGEGGIGFVVGDPQGTRQVRIELAVRHRNFRRIARLRRLVESLRGRLARPMGGGEIGAPVEGIVGRRLEAGL